MKHLVGAAAAMAALVSAYLCPVTACAFKDARFYRVEAWADGAAVTPETLQATADVITRPRKRGNRHGNGESAL